VQRDKRPFFPWKQHQTVAPDGEQLDKWAECYQPEAWAVITGAVSRLVVLDFDGKEGLATLTQLGLEPHVRTPSGGFHWYGIHDGRPIRTLNGKTMHELRARFPGMDVRADGGYAVFHGSISTGAYTPLRPPEPERLELLPESLRKFLDGSASEHSASGAQPAPDTASDLLSKALLRANLEGRNNAGFRLACQLRDAGYSRSYARETMTAFQARSRVTNQKGVAEPYTEREAMASLDQAYRRVRRESRTFALTDYGNAQRLAFRHGRDLRYVYSWGEWLIWDGRRWQRDVTGEVIRRAKDTVRGTYEEAAKETEAGVRKALAEHARKSEAEPRLRHMVELAKSEPGIPVTPDQFDAQPWLLSCENGTVDLKTGRLLQPRREDLITKLAPTEFDPEATDADWERVVLEACGGSSELVAFLARALGYSISGDTSEEKFFFIHGPSASGKSTVIEAVKMTLGDYAVTTDFETFLKRDQVGGPRNDLARLAGARMVISLEVEHGKRLAEGLVKQLTGGDTVSARFLHREFFEFRPQMKLWLAANHAPRVQSDDEAIWRRIVRIPFEHVIPEEERDPGLKSMLRNSKEARRAILAWLVRGCSAWQRERLSVPPAVKKATAAYRDEMDPLQDFFADRCVLESRAKTLSALLWGDYQIWAKDGGDRWPLTRKRFGEALKARGLEDVRLRGQRAWRGIRLAGPRRTEEAGAPGRSESRDPEPCGMTDETDRDAISEVVSPDIPPRGEDPEDRVLSRPSSVHSLGEWDQVMTPWFTKDAPGRVPKCDSTATPPDRPERPDAGLEERSDGSEEGGQGGRSSQ
jgi:putative DNA primase/helicase